MPSTESASPDAGLVPSRGFLSFATGAIRTLLPPGIRLFGAGLQFLSTILIARQLGDEGSAGFFLWSALLLSFAPVASFGFEFIALRTVPRLQARESGRSPGEFVGILRMISLCFAAVIGIGLILYGCFRDGPKPDWEVWFLLLPFALSSITITLINGEALKGLSRPVSGVVYGHTVPVSLFLILIVLSGDRLTSPLLVALYSFSYFVAVLVAQLGPFRAVKGSLFRVPPLETWKSLLRESWPIFLASSLGALSFIFPLLILDFTRPPEEVSYISTAYRISILFAVLTGAIHSVFAPDLSLASEVRGNRKTVFKVYWKATFAALGSLCVPVSLGILFPDLIMSIFGESFRAGSDELRALLLLFVFSLCIGPVYELLLMIGKTDLLMRLGFLKLSLVVVLSFLLIPGLGGFGMVAALAIGVITEEIIGLFLANRHLRKEALAETTGVGEL